MMWPRTLIGFFLGLFLAISLMLNLNFVLPIAVDARLITGLLLGFVLWASAMVYVYHGQSLRRASLNCLALLAISAAANLAVILFTVQ